MVKYSPQLLDHQVWLLLFPNLLFVKFSLLSAWLYPQLFARLWRYLQVHGEQPNYRALTFFFHFHLLNIIFSCMELLQLPQKCCMFRNGRENVRERIFSFGCGPDGKRVREPQDYCMISSFPSFAPFSPNLTKFLTWLRVALAFTKASTAFKNNGGSICGQKESMKAPSVAGVLLVHFPGFSPGPSRLQAGFSAFLMHISAHLDTQANISTRGSAPLPSMLCFASWERNPRERCGAVSTLGIAIQSDVYDNQPGRSPGLLLISLSLHAVLITRNMRGEVFPTATWRTLLDSSAVNFCSRWLSRSCSPADQKPKRSWRRPGCC